MRLVVTAEESKVLTEKVLKHSRPSQGELDQNMPIRLSSIPAALLGRLCGFEELQVEVDVEKPQLPQYEYPLD